MIGYYFKVDTLNRDNEVVSTRTGTIKQQLPGENFLVEYDDNPGIFKLVWVGNMSKGRWDFSLNPFKEV